MELSQLKPQRGSIKKRKRVGRGIGSGHGKTSCRGQKGQKSRSGGGKGPGFEGGQNPLHMRLPKLGGLKNPSAKKYALVKVGQLDVFETGAVVGKEALLKKGLAKGKLPVKVLADGELKKALTVKANHFSKQAQAKITKAGGKAEVVK